MKRNPLYVIAIVCTCVAVFMAVYTWMEKHETAPRVRATVVAPPVPDYYGHNGQTLLPNHDLTPGVARTTDRDQACQHTKEIRTAGKSSSYTLYNVEPHSDFCHGFRTTKNGERVEEWCENDHLIPLELGGANDTRNEWPEPYDPATGFGAHDKDRVENALHQLVCRKQAMDVMAAQQCIATDWVACGIRLGVLNPK